jgi:fructokinase
MRGRIGVLGEALIDLIVGPDGAYRPHLGGSPYNVAIGLARQGMVVSYLSPLSDDVFGEQLRESLEKEGVEVSAARASPRPTSLALVTIDEKGAPAYRLYREGIADKDISFEEIKSNLPDDLGVFHTGSLAITPSQVPKMQKLFSLMRDLGVVISLDINIRLRASINTQAYLDGVRSLLPLADIVKASDEDLEPFGLAKDPREAAAKAHEIMKSGILVLTEGKGGALLHSASGIVETTAFNIARVEDTIGAGDTFHSALLASLMRGGAIAPPYGDLDPGILGHAVEFACAAAAINVSRAGCSPPTQAEVDKFIQSTKR